MSKNHRKEEFNVRLNLFQSVRDDSRSPGINKRLPGSFITFTVKVSKTCKSVKQVKNRRYKNVGWNLFNSPFESGRKRETKLNSECSESVRYIQKTHNWIPRNFFVFTEQIIRTIKPVKHLKKIRYKNFAWTSIQKPTKNGILFETQLSWDCFKWIT